MAVNLTTLFAGKDVKVVDVEATADTDVTATISHDFNVALDEIVLIPLLANFYVSQWRVTSFASGNIVLTKGVGAGSGVAGAQVRCIIKRNFRY